MSFLFLALAVFAVTIQFAAVQEERWMEKEAAALFAYCPFSHFPLVVFCTVYRAVRGKSRVGGRKRRGGQIETRRKPLPYGLL